MTLTKSYTTRRSQPMIRSRLRRPTSKSTMAVLWPRRARPVPMAALDVVLPTPPLPEVTTRILAKVIHPKYGDRDLQPRRRRGCPLVLENSRKYPLKAGYVQHVAGQAYLYRFCPEWLAPEVFGHLVLTGNRDHFRGQLPAEDARSGVTLDARQGATTQW